MRVEDAELHIGLESLGNLDKEEGRTAFGLPELGLHGCSEGVHGAVGIGGRRVLCRSGEALLAERVGQGVEEKVERGESLVAVADLRAD